MNSLGQTLGLAAAVFMAPAIVQIGYAVEREQVGSIHFAVEPPASLWKRLKELLDSRSVAGVEWRFVRAGEHPASWSGPAVIVEIRGACEIPLIEAAWRPSPLGWVNIADGKWLPFIYVDCQRIAEAVRRGLKTAYARPEEPLAQALATVIRHELHHLTEQTRRHSRQGEFRAAIPARDLIHATRAN